MKYQINLTDDEEIMLSEYIRVNGFAYKAEACRALLVLGNTTDLVQEHLDMISMIIFILVSNH